MVVSRFGVMFFDDPVAAFANLRAATRSGGRLAFVCWRDPASNPFMGVAERAAGPLLPDLEPAQPAASGPFAFADPDRLRAILDAGGWGSVTITPVDVPCALARDALKPYLTRMGPIARVLPTLDDQTRTRVVAAILEAAEEYVVDDEARYTAACWMVNARA
ncbi:class I SAM-dependent methyltransferase [Mycolicibacterium palauense]|uniref:hypothetical protein n=1 Tax=Mycolicibacterium palauense TaxID=2034511 RepID=UPI000BFEB983|nr:hypothetical protein [Mycolicibacterium palauense]